MTSYSATQTFIGLSYVDRFAVIVKKGVYAPFVAADFLPVISQSFKKGINLSPYRCNVRGRAERVDRYGKLGLYI